MQGSEDSSVPEDSLERIAEDVSACTRCDLYQFSANGVPGSGNPHAEIMLIGEGPSHYDVRRGYPFSGPTGPFLDELLALAGLTRADVYLTNVLKHRVPDGRSPEWEELAACSVYLDRQIALVDPLIIVTLGRYALARYFPRGKITQLHGHTKIVDGRLVLAMYNPAAALHQEALRQSVTDDFRHALPAAIAEAHRLRDAGKLGRGTRPAPGEVPPQQMTLF